MLCEKNLIDFLLIFLAQVLVKQVCNNTFKS